MRQGPLILLLSLPLLSLPPHLLQQLDRQELLVRVVHAQARLQQRDHILRGVGSQRSGAGWCAAIRDSGFGVMLQQGPFVGLRQRTLGSLPAATSLLIVSTICVCCAERRCTLSGQGLPRSNPQRISGRQRAARARSRLLLLLAPSHAAMPSTWDGAREQVRTPAGSTWHRGPPASWRSRYAACPQDFLPAGSGGTSAP